MLKNYLTVALRTLRRQPGYSAITVGGLGLGLACCFLLVLFVRSELAYDRFHERGDRLHRVLINWNPAAGDALSATTPAGFAQHLPAEVPEIETAVRVEHHRRPYLRVGGVTRQVPGLAVVDPAFFEVFSFPLRRGDPAAVLDDPGAMVLSASTAEALFGDADPVGQTVVVPRSDGDAVFTVTGVMEDVPAASHLQFQYAISFANMTRFMGADALDNYTNSNYSTYVLLHGGADAEAVARKMTERTRARVFPDGADPANAPRLVLQPLHAVHFGTDVLYDAPTNRDVRYLWLFGGIGALVLVIACVNFMNLATARAAQRAREVGVRRAIGAERGQLVAQFLGESVLLSGVAVVIGLGLAAAALPAFNAAMGTALSLLDVGPCALLGLVGIGLAAGVAAGSYPAFYLSAFRPARVLRGEVTRGQGALLLRRGLIVGQFAASVFLVVAALTVYRQLGHMQAQRLGFEGEQVVFVQPPAEVQDRYEAFRERLLADPRVEAVAQAGGLPGRTGTNRGYNWPGAPGADDEGDSFWTIPADPDYVDALGLRLAAGRTFSRDLPTDTLDTYVLNETAAARLGFATPQDAVGQPFRAWDRPMGTVIGVVEDFHFQGLQEAVAPVVLNYIPWFGYVAVRLASGDVAGGMGHVRATWDAFAPGYALEYEFLDADFARLYEDERRLGQLFAFFAGVAVLIACLGLFGLAAFSAERRTKEIGVRKVLGAGTRDIVALLSKEFALLVGAAVLVATPLAYLAMSRWLEGFAYRVGLGPGVFLLAGAGALAVALLTVSTQALRAAHADPVRALRAD